MTYQEIIQSVGKQISKKVYYYDDSNTRVDVDEDNIEEIKIAFNCDLTGTLMKTANIILKEKLTIIKPLYVEITATYGTNTAVQTYGPYYIYETTYNADDKTYDHSCYDYMIKTMIDYVAVDISYPCTLQEYFNKLVATLGLTSSVSLTNGSNSLSSDVFDEINYTYRSVLQDIAQANGVLFYVDGTEIKIAEISKTKARTSVATITDDILKNTSIDFGDHYGPINVITLSRSADSDNIYYPETLPDDPHEYKISDNQLLNDNNRSDYIIGIYDNLSDIEYDIFDTELVGYGGFEPLQSVKFSTGGNTYTSYVFNNEIDFTDGYSETIYTDVPSDSTTDYTAADTTDQRINQTYLLVDKQNQTITSVVSQVDTQNSKINTIQQSVEELNSKIKEISDITTSGETSYASLDLTGVNASEPIHVKVFPVNKNISYQYPHSTLYPSSSTYLTTRTIRFYNKTTEETFDYVLPDNLYYYDSDTYDEFNLDHDTQTCQIIKRCGINSSGVVTKLSSSITTDYDYPSIDLSDGDYTISLLGYSTGYLFVRLMASNIYTTQFATRVELESSISQSKSEIETEVSEKYYDKDESDEAIATVNSRITQTASTITASVKQVSDDVDTVEAKVELKVDKDDNDQVVSMINASADQITLNSNRLVVNSSQFQLDASGNATFGGTISAAAISGSTMTGSTITGNAISGGSISITTGSYYFNMGVSTSHPNCSGLNVGSGGINFSNNNVGLNSSSGAITAGATFKAANFETTGSSDNKFNGNVYVYGGLKTNNINPSGSLAITTGSASVSPGSYGIYMRTYAGNITLDATNNGANSSYYVYARGDSLSNAKVKTDSGSASSRNTKTNIVKFEEKDYKEALDLLKNMNLYSYTYKYDLYKNREQYGFIIDEIQQEDNANKFFDFEEQIATVDGDKLDFALEDKTKETIAVKKYNTDTLDKYLLTCIKALQEKVDKLENKYE